MAHFRRMIGDKFNISFECDVVGQFHNMKQTGTVGEYVDKFEEIVSLIHRNNPILSEASKFQYWAQLLHPTSFTI